MTETSIHRHFKQLDDPRLERRKKYPLINLIFIAFCAILCGAEDWVSITRFGKARFNWLSQFLDLTNGIPSHDTFLTYKSTSSKREMVNLSCRIQQSLLRILLHLTVMEPGCMERNQRLLIASIIRQELIFCILSQSPGKIAF